MVRSALRSAFVPALLACAAAVLSPATASAQLKVGIVNFQQALLGTSEMKKASNDLMVKYKPQQDQLEKLQKDLNEIQAKLQDPKTPPATPTPVRRATTTPATACTGTPPMPWPAGSVGTRSMATDTRPQFSPAVDPTSGPQVLSPELGRVAPAVRPPATRRRPRLRERLPAPAPALSGTSGHPARPDRAGQPARRVIRPRAVNVALHWMEQAAGVRYIRTARPDSPVCPPRWGRCVDATRSWCSSGSTPSSGDGRLVTGTRCPAGSSTRWTVGCGSSATRGQLFPSTQAEALDHRPVLRRVRLGQEGPVGVRRPRQRRLPTQLRLDEDALPALR